MRLRVLGLICVVVALLSGIALFSNMQGSGRAWLDGVFLVAIGATLMVMLAALTKAAGRSIDAKIDQQRLEVAPERDDQRDDGRSGE
ncbi:MAG: hypothetical protein D6692_01890 [Planctomycetota bacterium]|nr:MAG: hypothetical protein D6692_01890 [Planctomycetota bacterium]